jgi:hypothetical protein
LVLAFIAGTVIAFGPAVAVANHIFSDVPTSWIFHGDIERVYDARITAGCSASTYCPTENVTRGQMAAFLSRTGGRVAYDTDGFAFDLAMQKVLATVTIRPGNVPGGTAFIKLDASMYAYTNGDNETGCAACTVSFYIDQRDSPNLSLASLVTLHNTSTTAQESSAGSITFVVPAPTGVDATFDLIASRSLGTGLVNAIGSLAATYYPFGGLGTDTLGPSISVDAGSGPMPQAPGS